MKPDLSEALRDTAQATVTALDRLIPATAVCEAAKEYLAALDEKYRDHERLRAALHALKAATAAWEAGRPN